MAKHYAIVANENGVAIQTPLKAWVRANVDQLPANFPVEGTTQAHKHGLIRNGWIEIPGIGSVFIIKPDINGSVQYANDFEDLIEMEVEENEDEVEAAQELTFGLEKDLQKALRKNIQSLEEGLVITDGGRERHTEAGFIDITARDSEGRTVVIELKAPAAKPEVIAQTLAYMQSVQAEDQCEVRGIIVASDFVDRVRLAAGQIPSIKLVKYAFQFNFNEVN